MRKHQAGRQRQSTCNFLESREVDIIDSSSSSKSSTLSLSLSSSLRHALPLMNKHCHPLPTQERTDHKLNSSSFSSPPSFHGRSISSCSIQNHHQIDRQLLMTI